MSDDHDEPERLQPVPVIDRIECARLGCGHSLAAHNGDDNCGAADCDCVAYVEPYFNDETFALMAASKRLPPIKSTLKIDPKCKKCGGKGVVKSRKRTGYCQPYTCPDCIARSRGN